MVLLSFGCLQGLLKHTDFTHLPILFRAIFCSRDPIFWPKNADLCQMAGKYFDFFMRVSAPCLHHGTNPRVNSTSHSPRSKLCSKHETIVWLCEQLADSSVGGSNDYKENIAVYETFMFLVNKFMLMRGFPGFQFAQVPWDCILDPSGFASLFFLVWSPMILYVYVHQSRSYTDVHHVLSMCWQNLADGLWVQRSHRWYRKEGWSLRGTGGDEDDHAPEGLAASNAEIAWYCGQSASARLDYQMVLSAEINNRKKGAIPGAITEKSHNG